MRQLVLYSSQDCCLCEQALFILRDAQADWNISIKKVDIFKDKGLLIKYRSSIPAVEDLDSGELIYWPFDQVILESWLKTLSKNK